MAMLMFMFTLLCFAPLAAQTDLFQDDGVLITHTGTVRSIDGFLTVVVVINSPEPPHILTWVDDVHQFIRRNNFRISFEERSLWEHRITRIMNVLRANYSDHMLVMNTDDINSHRVKRGLLNIVGKLGQSLFGLATTGDVEVLKRAVLESQNNAKALYSNENKLLSVFNKTRDFITRNHQTILRVEDEAGHLLQVVQSEANQTNELVGVVNSILMARHVDTDLQQMETLIQEFHTQRQDFHQHRLQLERGWLTEDILPPAILDRLLNGLQDNDMITASLPWYYQNIHVEPLWDHGTQLAYRVVLPGMSSENYLSYDIRYFSVPIGRDHLQRVTGAPAVAVNTATGHSFIPNPDQCLGNSPMVCHPSRIHLQDTCETRLVSGFGDPLCKIQIPSRKKQDSGTVPSELRVFWNRSGGILQNNRY